MATKYVRSFLHILLLDTYYSWIHTTLGYILLLDTYYSWIHILLDTYWIHTALGQSTVAKKLFNEPIVLTTLH